MPDGEWFCEQCKPTGSQPERKRRLITRKVFSIESADEDDLSSEDDGSANGKEHFYK